MDLSTDDGTMIGKDEEYIYQFINWNPWGTALLFQRIPLGGAYQPEIVMYDVDSGNTKVLTPNGSFPMWLP
jgi:hypothetical protein